MTREEAFPKEHSLRVGDSTRQRIQQLSMDRKKSFDSKNRDKLAALSAADRWASPLDADYFHAGADGTDGALHGSTVGKRKMKRKSKKDDISMSEHTGQTRKAKERDAGEADSVDKPKLAKPTENGDKLEDLLGKIDHGKPVKRRGARTVASMPSQTRSEGGEKERRGRSKSPHALRRKTHGEESIRKTRSDSDGPMKESSSRRRSSSQGALKRKSDAARSTRRNSKAEEEVSKPGDNQGRLGELLGNVGGVDTKKKSGSRSVASAPVPRRERERDRRAGTRPSVGSPRRRSTNENEITDTQNAAVPKRTKSTESAEAAPVSTSGRPSLSRRLSQGFKSFRKMAGLDSEKTSTTHTGDSSSIEQEQAPPRRAGRESTRDATSTRSKKKRSTSAGPLTNRVGSPRKDRGDRRAAMEKMKRNNSVQPHAAMGGDDDEEDEKHAGPPIRAQSMMLHREATRRNKANSLKDLVNYSEEEIHSTSYFASNHVLINRERMKRGLRPLTRNIAMDELARSNAERMATSGGVAPIQATYVGNVLRGESIRAIHRATMQNREGRERANLLNPYFQEFGVGTFKSEDGMLYICQLFSERLELTITDTTG
eukprot:Nitzschia sp. Nitz4//scaffold1_size375055//48727//50523//NITZ4_000220-RA/size375055-processed-gene-0.411-mRNA-1//-1//CDS//3329540877//2472//frame0